MVKEFTDKEKAIRLKEKADNISKKSIKIVVNCRQGERLKGCDFPIGNILDVEKIVFHCNISLSSPNQLDTNRFPRSVQTSGPRLKKSISFPQCWMVFWT